MRRKLQHGFPTPKYFRKKDLKTLPNANPNFKITLITGLIGLIGVLCGSIVTGYFSMKSQAITAEQQKTIFTRQLAANERQELSKTLSIYIDHIGEYYQLITSNKMKAAEIDPFAKKAFNSAAQISVLISLDLGAKTFELNQVFFTNLKAKSANTYTDKMEEDVVKKFGEWMAVAKGELKLLEYTASPDNLTHDAIRLFLKSAGSK